MKTLGRWFRYYDATLDHPKVQRLGDKMFRRWVNLLCIASRNGGVLPQSIEDLAFALRISEGQVRDTLQVLLSAGLLDAAGDAFVPHNWDERQFKSDTDPTARDRKQRQRDKSRTMSRVTPRDSHGSGHANVTRTDTDTDTDTDSASQQPPAAHSPLDLKKALWKTGVAFLMANGATEDRARKLIGDWRKHFADVEIINAFAAAEHAATPEPVAYVKAVLAGKEKPNGKGRQPQSSHPLGVFGELLERTRTRSAPEDVEPGIRGGADG